MIKLAAATRVSAALKLEVVVAAKCGRSRSEWAHSALPVDLSLLKWLLP